MTSYELDGVVDEEMEDMLHPPERKPKPRDWDQICAYKTFKIVRIKDRYLGMLYWFIVTLVFLYIIIFALGIEGKHQMQESGVGTVIAKYHGKAFDQDWRPFDEADLRFPEMEPSGVFIMTKSVTQKKQKLDECIDYDFSCETEAVACEQAGGTCSLGFCHHRAWCPSIGLANAKASSTARRVEVKTIGDTIVELMTAITFPGLGNTMFVTGQSEGAVNPFRNLTVNQIVEKIEPPQKLGDLVDEGALIGLSFLWDCDVTLPNCEPEIFVKRLDEGKGFAQRRARRYRIKGEEHRDATIMYGLRFLVDSSGIGGRFSFVLAVIQLGSCLALMRTAAILADFIMLKCYPKKKAEMYYKCKVIETKDYSDLQDRLNLIQERAPEVANLLSKDKFGLGPGGRGGMASVVLRASQAHSM